MLTPSTTDSKKQTITLQQNERVLSEGRARKRYIHASAFQRTLVGAFVAICIALPICMKVDHLGPMLAAFLIVDAFYLVMWGVQHMSWSWHRWWLTDQRLVVRHGMVGYQVQSVPLDRIVDVTLRASWLDRLFGLEHITVRDMTGEVSSSAMSVGLNLFAVENAEAVADAIITASRGGNSDR